jgi:hypothetical protein
VKQPNGQTATDFQMGKGLGLTACTAGERFSTSHRIICS